MFLLYRILEPCQPLIVMATAHIVEVVQGIVIVLILVFFVL
jgi:hypothetical protein